MTPRERVLTALKRGQPDRVPWVENDFEEEIQIKVMGGRTDFTPGELCRTLGMDGFGYHFPTGQQASAGQALQTSGSASAKEAWYHPQRVTFDFVPPWIAEMGVDGGAASYKLDFGGELKRDARVRITTGMSSVEIRVPAGTAAKIVAESTLGGFDIGDGFMKKEGAFWTEAALAGKTPVLTIVANVSLGGLMIRAV